MYFATTPERLWSGGHANVGSAGAVDVLVPSGRARAGTFFTTFILMSNPQDTPANVTLRFLLQEGAPVEITRTIPAQAAPDDQSGRRGRIQRCRTSRSRRS